MRLHRARHPEESADPSADGDDEPAAAGPQFACKIVTLAIEGVRKARCRGGSCGRPGATIRQPTDCPYDVPQSRNLVTPSNSQQAMIRRSEAVPLWVSGDSEYGVRALEPTTDKSLPCFPPTPDRLFPVPYSLLLSAGSKRAWKKRRYLGS